MKKQDFGSKKIGILTFHKAHNYGACLQAFALQKALDKLGLNNEIIDYRNSYLKKVYNIFHFNGFKKILNSIYRFISHPDFIFSLKWKYIRYKDFLKKNTIQSKPIERKNLYKLNGAYDYFLTGSDQIWNLKLSNTDTSYMLDFVTENKKKKSYAASFGKEKHSQNEVEIYKRYLWQYNSLLVREESGKNILEDLKCKSSVVLDPVLLHDKKFWLNYIDPTPIVAGDYIVTYFIQEPTLSYEFAKQIAKNNNSKIVHINTGEVGKKYKDSTYYNSLWPQEFLNVIANASSIITTSFHGLSFAILFNIPFWYELHGQEPNTNARLSHLANIVSVNKQEITSTTTYNPNNIINWWQINNILEEERQKSLSLLLKSF